MQKRNPMTVAGHRALNDELSRRKNEERPKIIHDIEVARAHGDLRENAEYHAAKERHGFNEGRIAEIAEMLATAEIVNPSELSGEKVIFGATVLLEDTESGEKITYQIVGEFEADVKKSKINYQSPLARSLVGKFVGDEVTVRAPKGEMIYEILKVEFK